MEAQPGCPALHALRIAVTIPETRRLEIVLPPGLPSGPAEIIVLAGAGSADEADEGRDRLAGTLSQVTSWRGRRSAWRPREELDRELVEERSSWEPGG